MTHSDPSADEIRNKDGFLERGLQVTRLDAFVDAAFAFAVTLLVISVDSIPDSTQALIVALKSIPAFAVSFAMIAMFWSAHARWSRRYGLDDQASTVLSLVLVFLVMIYVYPLRLQFGIFFYWITQGWLPSPFKNIQQIDVGFMFVVYGLAFATMSLCLLALYVHAWRRRVALDLQPQERAATRGEIATYGYFFVIAIASTLLAIMLPMRNSTWLTSLPGMTYCLLGLTGMVEARARRHEPDTFST